MIARFTRTLPAAHSFAATERLSKKRACHSHLSILSRASLVPPR
jgi:hypothetical protein